MIALSNKLTSCFKRPIPRLQFSHKIPLIFPVSLLWSTARDLPLLSSGLLHIAQHLPCLVKSASYSIKVMPYVIFKYLLRTYWRYLAFFSGEASRYTYEYEQSLQYPYNPSLQFRLFQKSEKGFEVRHLGHRFMPLIITQYIKQFN